MRPQRQRQRQQREWWETQRGNYPVPQEPKPVQRIRALGEAWMVTILSMAFLMCAVVLFTQGRPRGSVNSSPPSPGGQSDSAAASCNYYVAPTGAATGDGTFADPWTLDSAIVESSGLSGNDTVCVRGGTYNAGSSGAWYSTADGTDRDNLLVYRNYPITATSFEQVTINGPFFLSSSSTSFANYVRWQAYGVAGITFTSVRPDTLGLNGFNLAGHSSQAINLVIHNSGKSGLAHQNRASSGISYGNIVYNVGQNNNLDHGAYIIIDRDSTSIDGKGTIFRENVLFNNWSHNVNQNGSGLAGDTLYFVGNVMFNAALLSNGGTGRDLRLFQSTTNIVVADSNYVYSPYPANTTNLFFGSGNNDSLTIRNNYFMGGFYLAADVDLDALVLTGNTFWGTNGWAWFLTTTALGLPNWEGNAWWKGAAAWNYIYITDSTDIDIDNLTDIQNGGEAVTNPATKLDTTGTFTANATGEPASGINRFVRPNAYETGRGHIIIYNWDQDDSVGVVLDNVLTDGDTYEIYNVQNLYGAAVTSGTHTDGDSVYVDMTAIAAPVPVQGVARGAATVPSTGPKFNVFLIIKTG